MDRCMYQNSIWPLRLEALDSFFTAMRVLGTHEQTSLQWEGSQQPLLWLPAHHQRLSQAGAMLATAYPRRCAGRIGVGRSEHQAAGPDARPGSSPDPPDPAQGFSRRGRVERKGSEAA